MEKQTKILLGVGAVIAAYLIFKPKKAVATKIVASAPINTTDRLICPNGYIYGMNVVGGVVGIMGGCKDSSGNFTNVQPIQNPNYVQCECFRAPCNCGANGVDLRALMSKQVYES